MRQLLLHASQVAGLAAIAAGVALYDAPAGLITAGVLTTAVHLVRDFTGDEPAPKPAGPIA